MLTRTRPSPKQPERDREHGFTLVEVMIAMTIILAATTAFALFLGATSAAQRSDQLSRTADRVLSQQVEETQGQTWANLMMAPLGGYTDCVLAGDRISTQTVQSGPETIALDHTDVSVTREVRWLASNNLVECDTNRNQADLKAVTVTATWVDGAETRTRKATVLRSVAAEHQPANTPLTGSTLTRSVPTNSADGWCASFPGEPAATATATVTGSGLTVTFPTEEESTCGYRITGLTAGKTYTAVMNAFVPTGGTQAELAAGTLTKAGLVTPDGVWHTVTTTWTETGTERVVGLTIAGAPRPEGSQATISNLDIYVD